MRRAIVFVMVAAVFPLIACRAVVGIDSLELADSGSTPAKDATADGADSGAKDADVGDANSCTTAADCVVCCRNATSPANPTLDQFIGQCACGPGGACTSQCNASVCAPPDSGASGTMPTSACTDCLDTQLKGMCASALNMCNNNATCKPIVGCIQACP